MTIPSSLNARKTVTIPEFGIKFKDVEQRSCLAKSGPKIHGLYIRKENESCEDPTGSSGRPFSIYASYNTDMKRSLKSLIPANCKIMVSAFKTVIIRGYRTKTCSEKKGNFERLYIVFQSHSLTDIYDNYGTLYPKVNYTITFVLAPMGHLKKLRYINRQIRRLQIFL